ncbi:alanine--tRNA ligase [Candidatus Omnitrophota bacterium]
MKTDVIRQKFLDFFAAKGHKVVASDYLVPSGDPTVLFTSAGMNQFKKQFLGNITDYKKAASCQKCLRTDDLEHVGKTSVHHTFFEMLGNFSFGDYFKKEAIEWAWEFLTDTLSLSADKLWASVYHDDEEAHTIWLKTIKLPKERLVKLGDKENFWPAEAKTKGPNGPCGPCSEIFYDYGPEVGCKKSTCSPACSCGRFAEVWNLVFTQYNRTPEGTLEPLPSKNIDTGMGLERLASVMQGVTNNFETDLFIPIINALKKEIGIKKESAEQLVKLRIIADHIRAVVIAISDGVNPSNEERGYIIRKLVRICVNNYRALGVTAALLYKIVLTVAQVLKNPYPELVQRRENIADIVKREEESFLKIVEKQELVSIETMKVLKKECKDGKKVSIELAKLAFDWHDTYGFPFESTESVARNLKLSIDKATFDKLMQEQKDRSRAASTMGKDVFVGSQLQLDVAQTKFEGYEMIETTSKIIKLFDNTNKEIDVAQENQDVAVVLEASPFYGEAGGQLGDTGYLAKKNAKLEVNDTVIIDGIIIHKAKVAKGTFSMGDSVQAFVDYERRLSIARNHTATHILQAVLKKVLGDHVQQQGSLVAEDKLRFDFSHFKPVTAEELIRIEQVVNSYVLKNDTLECQEKDISVAKKEGALAFFDEKYNDTVRVVSVGDYSKELCGGTHLSSTGQIGLFSIISESSVAQGIRRIEATTGAFAYSRVKQKEKALSEIADILKVEEAKIVDYVTILSSSFKKTQKSLSNLKLELFKQSVDEIIARAKKIQGITVIVEKQDDVDFTFLRAAVDLIKRTTKKSTVIAMGSVKDKKAMLVVGLTDDVIKKGLDASDLIKEMASCVAGTGGGRKDFAQAGGTKHEKLSDALDIAVELIKKRVQ